MIPCQHMLALFEHIEDISCDRSPSSYGTLPFFNLGDGIISTLQVEENESQITNVGLEKQGLLRELASQFY